MRLNPPHIEEAENEKNCTITVDSVFDYQGPDELFCFLGICQHNNNTAYFVDEDLLVPPNYGMEMQVRLLMMSWLSTDPVEVEQYLKYRAKKRD